MPRSPIRNKDIDVISDNGTPIISIREGEQLRFTVNCDWITNMTGFEKSAVVVEGLNQAGDLDEVPFQEAETPQIVSLPIIDADLADGSFEFVITEDLISGWDQGPTPDDPVYGFISVRVADTGVGNNQQIWFPISGLVEIRYNAKVAS